MTIDEAIRQFKYDAECNRADLDLSYAQDNEQVAEWLEELKAIKDGCIPIIHGKAELELHDKAIRTKAIDDFIKSEDYLMEKIKEEKAEVSIDYEWRKVVCLDDIRRMLHQGLLEIAEQLKAGGENERM